MLKKSEFLKKKHIFNYIDIHGKETELRLEENSLCFTYCQVPVVYKLSDKNDLKVFFNQGTSSAFEKLNLDTIVSKQVFGRTGEVIKIVVHLKQENLR
jgi:hypothetical protein